jgi:hypothetical protein
MKGATKAAGSRARPGGSEADLRVGQRRHVGVECRPRYSTSDQVEIAAIRRTNVRMTDVRQPDRDSALGRYHAPRHGFRHDWISLEERDMTTIDASKLPANAVKALVSGEGVKLTRAGRVIAVLHATPARFRVSAARAKQLLQ